MKRKEEMNMGDGRYVLLRTASAVEVKKKPE